MSWRCPNPKCRGYNADSDTSCSYCGYIHQKTPNQGRTAAANTAQPPAGRWVIACPECRNEIAVEGKDAELEQCPICKKDSIETERAFFKFFKEEAQPVRADEPPAPRPRLFIQEIAAEPEVSDKFIYHQKGRMPKPISDKIEIFPPEMEFGRNLLPERGDYYRTISEKHCKFRCDENGNWFVSDTNSTNGTRVNFRFLLGSKEVPLPKESTIQMANRLFAVFIE